MIKRNIAALALVAFAGLVMTSWAYGGTKEDAYAAVERWESVFNAGEVENILAAYTPDALVLGTLSPSLASKPDDLRTYFGAAAAAKSQVKIGESSAIVLSNEAVVFTGFYEFTRIKEGQTVTLPSRFTFVVEKRNGAWKIVHHHSSLRPQPPQ